MWKNWTSDENVHSKRWFTTKSTAIKEQQQLKLFTIKIDKEISSKSDYRNTVNSMCTYKIFFLSDCRLFTTVLTVEGQDIQFEINSGSDISAIPEKIYRELLRNCKLHKNLSILRSYNNAVIKIVGHVEVVVRYNEKDYDIKLIVIKGEVRPLLGKNLMIKFCIGLCVNSINETNASNGLFEEKVTNASNGL